MRTVIRFVAVGIVLPVAVAAWSLRPTKDSAALKIRPNVLVTGTPSPAQLEMARWAVARFEAALLVPPTVEIEFHGGGSGCAGHIGFARRGQVDVCSVLVNAMSRRVLLHELSHVWLDQNTSIAARARFLRSRGLRSWNGSDVEWRSRGFEQGAEVLAWALGERILDAQIPNNDPTDLSQAYELLTGRPLSQVVEGGAGWPVGTR